MNLEKLLTRAQEIETAILNITAQLNALHGHKTELSHWISQFQSPTKEVNETQVEFVVEPVVA